MDQHGCTAGAALEGTCYLTKYEFFHLKGIIKNNHFAFKTVPTRAPQAGQNTPVAQ